MKKLVYLFGFAVVLASCSGGDDDSPATAENTLVKKMIFNDGVETLTTNISYNGTKLTGSTDSDGTHTVVTYTGDLITKWEFFTDDTVTVSETYEYNAQGQLVKYVNMDLIDGFGEKYEYTHNSDGTISYDYFYGDADAQDTFSNSGRIYPDKVEEYSSDPDFPETYTSTFTYDSKHNPFMNVTGYGKIAFAGAYEGSNHMNNILQESYQGTVYSTYTYTYNSSDFPTSEHESTVDGEEYSYQYFYN